MFLSSTGNTLLEPETSTEIEFGFDAGLFGDRLGVDFTYFKKNSKDALIQRRLPGSLGLTTSVFDNLGNLKRLHRALGNLLPGRMISAGLSAPLHPGAARYYRENGMM